MLCCNSGSFLNNDERNAVEKTCDSSSDLQAVTLTKVNGMHFGVTLPIPIELTLIITYLLMSAQQYLTLPLIMMLLWLAMLEYITMMMN
jgi:hypothetical protein